jgi:hypothetical protein
MPVVKFSADFVFVPPAKPMVSIKYKAGSKKPVVTECARAAVAAGKAKYVRQKRAEDDGSGQAPGTPEIPEAG